jgi:hypothetical protein
LYINVFLSKPAASTGFTGTGDRYENITVNIVDPGGVKTTLGPSQADPTGGVWYTFVPSKVGNYTFQAFYAGQVLTYGTTYNGLRYLASSSVVVTVVVQQAPISGGYVSPPLPTEYWSRPIYATNYAWAALGGNWLGLRASGFANTGMYDATGSFQPYSTAPNTAHIIWVKPTAFGGQVGAPMPADQVHQYVSTSIALNEWEPIIINGILYYELYPTVNSVPQSWQAIDLRTGEPLSTFNTTAGLTNDERLRYGEVLGFHTIQEYGSYALLWSIPRTGATVFRLYDPMTGEYMAQIVNAIDMPMISDYNPDTTEPGTLLGWYTSGGNLTLWNSTLALAYPNGFVPVTSAFGTYLYQITIRPSGTINFSAGNQWTKPIPTTLAGNTISPALSIAARTPEVILLRSATTVASQASNGYQITAGFDARTGALLWGPLNQTLPMYQDISVLAARDGVYVLRNKDSDEVYGYSLTSGQKLWGPVKLPGNAWSTITLAAEIAYGRIYIYDYGGYVNALDLKTGAIDWTWSPRSAGYNTPYGIYPIWTYSELVCDGKIFLPEGKMYDPPLSPGAQRLVINCTDGKLVWSILSWAGRMTAAAADGYVVQWNSYDKQIDCFGKGQTATTVSAPLTAITQGQSVMITGTVTDESPGTKDSDRKARFPHGVAAVTDASMSAWMEYVYMQQPYPTNCTGVQVTLDAYDPNGNFVHLGTATSDTSGTFGYAWTTPDVPGKYTVIATFAGSESYWPSYAETYAGVSEAPIVTPPPTYPIPMDYTMSIIGTGIAVIIAVAIVGLILLRKRP